MSQYLLPVDAEGHEFTKNLFPLGVGGEGRILLPSFPRDVS